MNEEAISYIMQKMSNCLDNSQMMRLEKTLEEALRGESIVSLKPSEREGQTPYKLKGLPPNPVVNSCSKTFLFSCGTRASFVYVDRKRPARISSRSCMPCS